jgi:hypothetical protein
VSYQPEPECCECLHYPHGDRGRCGAYVGSEPEYADGCNCECSCDGTDAL